MRCSILALVIGCSLGGEPRAGARGGGDNGGRFDPSAFVPVRE